MKKRPYEKPALRFLGSARDVTLAATTQTERQRKLHQLLGR